MNLEAIKFLTFVCLLQPVPPASSNYVDDRIKELTIKAITSIELASMTYNETPNLYFLYRNFTRKRFESKHRNHKDLDEKYENFQKIHEFHGLQNILGPYRNFRDVSHNKQVSLDPLEIFQNSPNRTDEEITKYGLLTKAENGGFLFHERDLASYFVAEYFHKYVFHPIDHPSGDEMLLRLRLLLSLTTDEYSTRPFPNAFIMAMIEGLDGPVFSGKIREIMKGEFRSLLEMYHRLDLVDKVSKIFKKDEKILGGLWGLDENCPYFLRFFRFMSSVDRVYELRDIARKYFEFSDAEKKSSDNIQLFSDNIQQFSNNNQQFSDNNQQFSSAKRQFNNAEFGNSTRIPAEYILKGRNQTLVILFWIYYHKNENFTKQILEVTQTSVNDEILSQLKQKIIFLDFVDFSQFSNAEKREFFLLRTSEMIDNCRNSQCLSDLWTRLQKLFSTAELKTFLMEKDRHFDFTHLFLLPSHDDLDFVRNFLDLIKKHLSRTEIRELLEQRAPVTRNSFLINYMSIVMNAEVFEICWNFTKEYLSHEELRGFLFNKPIHTFLRKAFYNRAVFKLGMEILSEFYTQDAIRALLTQPDENEATVLFWLADAYAFQSRHYIINYLKEIFKNHKEMLRELFKKRNRYGETVFGYCKSSVRHADCLDKIRKLAKDIFSEDEYEELMSGSKKEQKVEQ